METLELALATAFETIKTDAISLMATAAPAAIVIMGIGLVVTLGITFFKKISKA